MTGSPAATDILRDQPWLIFGFIYSFFWLQA